MSKKINKLRYYLILIVSLIFTTNTIIANNPTAKVLIFPKTDNSCDVKIHFEQLNFNEDMLVLTALKIGMQPHLHTKIKNTKVLGWYMNTDSLSGQNENQLWLGSVCKKGSNNLTLEVRLPNTLNCGAKRYLEQFKEQTSTLSILVDKDGLANFLKSDSITTHSCFVDITEIEVVMNSNMEVVESSELGNWSPTLSDGRICIIDSNKENHLQLKFKKKSFYNLFLDFLIFIIGALIIGWGISAKVLKNIKKKYIPYIYWFFVIVFAISTILYLSNPELNHSLHFLGISLGLLLGSGVRPLLDKFFNEETSNNNEGNNEEQS